MRGGEAYVSDPVTLLKGIASIMIISHLCSACNLSPSLKSRNFRFEQRIDLVVSSPCWQFFLFLKNMGQRRKASQYWHDDGGGIQHAELIRARVCRCVVRVKVKASLKADVALPQQAQRRSGYGYCAPCPWKAGFAIKGELSLLKQKDTETL